jgi:hypothetical protein
MTGSGESWDGIEDTQVGRMEKWGKNPYIPELNSSIEAIWIA